MGCRWSEVQILSPRPVSNPRQLRLSRVFNLCYVFEQQGDNIRNFLIFTVAVAANASALVTIGPPRPSRQPIYQDGRRLRACRSSTEHDRGLCAAFWRAP